MQLQLKLGSITNEDQIYQHFQFPVKQTTATQGPSESLCIIIVYSAIHNSQQLMNLVSAAVSI